MHFIASCNTCNMYNYTFTRFLESRLEWLLILIDNNLSKEKFLSTFNEILRLIHVIKWRL